MTLTQAELDFEVKRDRRLRTFKRQNKQFVGCWCLTSLTRYWHKCGSAGRKGKDLIKSGGNISTWECNIYFHGDTLIYIHIRVSKWDHHSLKRFNGGEIIIFVQTGNQTAFDMTERMFQGWLQLVMLARWTLKGKATSSVITSVQNHFFRPTFPPQEIVRPNFPPPPIFFLVLPWC